MAYTAFVGSMYVGIHNSNENKFKSKRFVPVGLRKKIKGFSKDARRNLLRSLQCVNYEELNARLWNAYFITLTYQYSDKEGKEDFYFTWKNSLTAVKSDLDNFFKRLDYYFKKLSLDWFCFWKMEFFKNAKVPHFHLMLFVAPSDAIKQASLKDVISSMWVGVITKGTKISKELKSKMLSASTNVRYTPLNRYEILQVYISKEIGKEYQIVDDEYTGRFWGIAKRKIYKEFYLEDRYLLTEKSFFKLRRIFKKYLRKKGYKYKNRSDYGMKLYFAPVDDVKRLINYFESGVINDEKNNSEQFI